ncbi:zinc finger CCCH domain-containing protein 14-like [Andrographis paniculata]|uniref:zinc finger CCCH domain-containing protein 14-like n=1 Tax=Andrographis paniculata TaxID=175694 RepID=UPI0021E89543|nr:zinc finger CCCH domain-containing protein 14-like [Andrographis paniculata]
MEFGKRGRDDGGFYGNGGFKKSKQESESFTPGIGSKSKPCTKFFSPSGCSFGEGCHFSHYIPGGIKAVTQMLGTNPALPPTSRNSIASPSFPDGSSPPAVKTRLCSKFNTPEGCKFGDKCRFAHGQRELGRQSAPSFEDPHSMPGRYGGANPRSASGFGASATAKISIDASMAGAIIGKNGINSKQICRTTGSKLSIREHESDPNLRNIELEGTFDQIKQASQMVRELIVNINAGTGGLPSKNPMSLSSGHNPGIYYKTKLCDKFANGSCTYGDRCHFAHGAEELREQPAMM